MTPLLEALSDIEERLDHMRLFEFYDGDSEMSCVTEEQYAKDKDEVMTDLRRCLEIIKVLSEALSCNETFHRLGGIDDCEPCKAQTKALKIAKGPVRI